MTTSGWAFKLGLCTAAMLVALAPSSGLARNSAARELLRQGDEMFAAGDYDKARRLFQKAYEADQSAVFLRSLANALVKVRWHADALKRFREYLSRFPDARDRAEVQQMVEHLDIVVRTKLTVRTKPLGAAIYVDAEVGAPLGETPYAGTIEPGTHTLFIKKQGYRTLARRVVVQPGSHATLALPLEVPLHVTSVPVGATVHLDSESADPVGRTPLETGLPVGRHTIHVRHPGLTTFSMKLEVRDPGKVTIDAELTRPVPVRSVPAGARVVVDGKTLPGHTPLVAALTPGRHRVELRMKGLAPVRQEVEVTRSAPEAITGRLSGGALLSMRSEPSGATVSMGEIALGKTPMTRVPVPPGLRQVTLEHPGRRTWDGDLHLREGGHVSARVKLGRRTWPVWTLVALAGVAGVVGTITGVAALDHDHEVSSMLVEERTSKGRPTGRLAVGACNGGERVFDNMYDATGGGSVGDVCGNELHHATTALLTTAGVSAAGALLYYLFFVRPSAEVGK